MSGAAGTVAQPPVSMQRGFFARLRFFGAAELASFMGVMIIGLIANDAVNGRAPASDGTVGDLIVLVYLMWSVAVRIAVATEYVSADQQGVRWRSLFRASFVPWDQVESVGISQVYLFPSRSRDDVIHVRTTDGRTSKLRASAWCERAAQRWLGEALGLRPGNRPSDPREVVLQLSGFESALHRRGQPDWEPKEGFDGVDPAVEAARRWLVGKPNGLVEVVEFRGQLGRVIRVVTPATVEPIDES